MSRSKRSSGFTLAAFAELSGARRWRWLLTLAVASALGCNQREDALDVPDPFTEHSVVPPASTKASSLSHKPLGATPRFDDDAAIEALCESFASLSLPEADAPSPAERKSLARCDSEALYYGIAKRPDFERARKCAYLELERKSSAAFGGATLLMMLYANGRSVSTNFDLALKFACTRRTTAAERRLTIEPLWKARAGAGLSKVFDVCDYEGETVGRTECLTRDLRILGAKRDARKAKAVMGLQSRELTFLERVAHDFFELRVHEELDRNNPFLSEFQLKERARLAEEYVDLLEKLADRTFSPSVTESADGRLNAFHARLLACKDLTGRAAKNAGFSRVGLAQSQRAWNKYRDAWLALVAKARPRSAVPAWNALLVEQRLQMLESIPLCRGE